MTAALAAVPEPADLAAWDSLARSWGRSLRTERKTARTVAAYLDSLATLQAWAANPVEVVDPDADEIETRPRDGGPILSPADLTTADYRAFQEWRLLRTTRRGRPASPSYVAKDYRHQRVFFAWLVAEEEIAASPLVKVKPPKIDTKPVPLLDDADVAALLDACKGAGFVERRDAAIVRVLLDTGIRRDELAGMTLDDLDLDRQSAVVHGKGRKTRTVTFGVKTADALDRYLRSRSKHPDRRLPFVWLADERRRGRLLGEGVAQMLGRRAAIAGVEGVHPHRFRHTAADARLSEGMSEGDAMRFFGWESRSMLDRYGKAGADRRAVEASRRFSPADRF